MTTRYGQIESPITKLRCPSLVLYECVCVSTWRFLLIDQFMQAKSIEICWLSHVFIPEGFATPFTFVAPRRRPSWWLSIVTTIHRPSSLRCHIEPVPFPLNRIDLFTESHSYQLGCQCVNCLMCAIGFPLTYNRLGNPSGQSMDDTTDFFLMKPISQRLPGLIASRGGGENNGKLSLKSDGTQLHTSNTWRVTDDCCR